MKSEKKEELLSRIRRELDFREELSEGELKELIGQNLSDYSRQHYLTVEERNRLGKQLFYSIRKLDVLQELLDDPDITEIMINGPGDIFVEKKGQLSRWNMEFYSEEKLSDVIQQITSRCNRMVNEASPIVDARLPDGSRVNVILPPIALNGPILTIRRFSKEPVSMKWLTEAGSISEETAEELKLLVRAGYNIFISGGTGSGKTTFLNALSEFIPRDERVITIEDSAELRLMGVDNLIRLETRNANTEGCRAVTIRDLIRCSLRQRPDRIVVGEVRGEEALDLLQAMNTGHDGSLSTGHANSAKDMLSRLETMVLMGMELPLPAIRRQIASALDIIIHLSRLRDKSRKVVEITEVCGYEDGEIKLNCLYSFEEEKGNGEAVKGRLVKKNELLCREKLLAAGLPGLQV